jgi:DNA invertase Pin-like site-specific DNA recombinase
MLIGYARTSTVDQLAGFEAQKADLIAVGCDARRMFVEQISSVATQRPQLARMLDQLRPGDVVVVTKLDRLARSMTDLIAIVGKIEAAGASLRVLGMNLDTSTATGKLMLNVLGSVAAFERDMMLERQKIGIAQAKADGKYRGRAPTAMRKADEAVALLKSGVKPAVAARKLGIARSSLYRIMDERGLLRGPVQYVEVAR